jgi:fatty-acyl-CoA synthase
MKREETGVRDHPKIRDSSDIAEIERRGFEAYLPHRTPFALIEASAAKGPDRPAVRYLRQVGAPETDLVLTYAQFVRRIRQAANLFRSLGVEPADAVAILAPHSLSTQIALWGAELACRACPINPMLSPEHVAALLRAAKAKVAVVLGANDDIEMWSRLVPTLRKDEGLRILDCDADRRTSGSDGCFEDLLNGEPADALTFEPSADPNATAAFFHTGGTTGAPKLAIHTLQNQAFVARSAALMYDLRAQDVLVNGFPLFHVAGAFVYGLSVFAAGGSILIPTRLGMRNQRFVRSIWKQVEHSGVTVIGGVPTVMSALLAVPVDADISSLRVMLTGGSPLPTELAEAFERSVGKPVRNILGMTECAGVVTIEPFGGSRSPGSTGVRLPFTEVRAFRQSTVFDPSSPCRVGETGVIALRGPNVGPGYSDQSRNRGTFEADGWLVSGDLGHVDVSGQVHVTGRAKDVIIRGAHNIDPALIEDALLKHPAIAVAAAVGQPDPYAGELPVAFVVLKPDQTVDAEAIRAFVAPLVSEPAAHPKHVTILAEMPLTPVGKIYKPALRVIATCDAVRDALVGANFHPDTFAVACTEDQVDIRLVDSQRLDEARKALVGLPVQYVVS